MGERKMNTEKKLVPSLRFPTFIQDGEWKKQKFSSLFVFLPNNTLSRADLTERKGDVYNVHYGDVLIKLDAYTDIQQGKLPAIKTINNIDKYLKARLQDGDIVIADTAEDETVGKCTEIVNVHDTIVVSGLHTIPCRPQIKFAQAYLGYYMNSNAFHSKLLPIMQGVKVTSISKSALQNIDLAFPESLEEQQKIAECLSSIDSYISSINEKVEQLKAHKKSLMQKLFPQRGQTVPEYRFPEFNNTKEWEIKKVGDIATTFSGGTPSISKKQYYGGDIPFIRSGEIKGTKTELSLTQLGVEKTSAKLVSAGTILYALYGATSGEVAISKISGAINQAILAIIVDNELCEVQFLYQILLANKEKILDKYLQGGQGNLSGSIITNLQILLPPLVEQSKIAECLSSIDRAIECYSQKSILLEQHKKGLMQQLLQQLFLKS